MNNILIIDTETTGLEPTKGALILEMGALLFNVEDKVVLQTMSTFLPCIDNPVQYINNIDPIWTQRGQPYSDLLDMINRSAFNADLIIAHNAQFDIKFIKTIYTNFANILTKPWMCTQHDFEWPVPLVRRRLKDVCEAMGVPYVDAHRALADCRFIADCFAKIPDLDRRLEQARRRYA
jgi:DNA polymerase-3 subunit epsilon